MRPDAGDGGAGQIQGREEGERESGSRCDGFRSSLDHDGDDERVHLSVEGAVRLRHPSFAGRR